MKKTRLFALWLSLLLLFTAAIAVGQTAAEPPAAGAGSALPVDVVFGYRTLKLSGNEQMYRTQVNERSGFLLRSFTMVTSDFNGGTSLFDRFRVDASDLGAGPAGAFRIEASKADVYRFTLGFRRAEAFDSIAGYPNPGLPTSAFAGTIIADQHSWNRLRNTIDADLEFLPGHVVAPFVGFSTNHLSGMGASTYHQGGDEFAISQDLNDRDREFRVGSLFTVGNVFYGSVTQGWRKLNSRQDLGLIGPATGNSTTPILGRDPRASTIVRSENDKVSTPFTNLHATLQLARRVRITGNYVRLNADANGSESESLTGSFVSFGINRFFNGLTETATDTARNKTWRGGGRAELTVIQGLDAFVAYQQDHRDLSGAALINTLYSGTTNFSGLDPRDVTTVLNAQSAITRKEAATSVGASYRPVAPVSLRAEYRETKQNADVAPDLSEIVVPGNQGGTFERKVKTIDTNASVSKLGFTLGAAYRRDTADNPIFRTDFEKRNRLRLRGSYAAPKWVRVGVTAENLKQSHPDPVLNSVAPAFGLDGKVRQYSADVEVAPVKQFAVRASLSQFKADNSILYRRPENFLTGVSVYTENGKAKEGGVLLSFAPVSFDASMSRFENRGDNPFNIDRARLRLGIDIPKTHAGIVAEYDRDKYHELIAASGGDFNATRYGIFLSIHP